MEREVLVSGSNELAFGNLAQIIISCNWEVNYFQILLSNAQGSVIGKSIISCKGIFHLHQDFYFFFLGFLIYFYLFLEVINKPRSV